MIKAIDKVEDDLVSLLDALDELPPEDITPALKERYLNFFACLDEFYSGKAAHIAYTFKKL